MDRWSCLGARLVPCWDVVAASVGHLNLRQYLSWPALSTQQDVWLRDRRFAVLRLLGEGGYSFVYLVKEVPTPQRPHVVVRQYALKKVLIGSQEQLAAAEQEVETMRQLRHPNLMPLLDASIEEAPTPEGPRRVAYMLFPLYEVCEALQAMHSMEPGLAHRDVKPHNVLLRRRGGSLHPQQQQQQQQQHDTGHRRLYPNGNGSSGSGKRGTDSGPAYAALTPVGAMAVEDTGAGLELQQMQSGALPSLTDEAEEASLEPGCKGEYHAVLMDFGSTQPARVEVFNRIEAMAVQEDAEAHCTAPYRAPELWDVPSRCALDERLDVWSVGCLLYFMLAGESPFERVLNEAGGSLLLAVVNGRVSWPAEWRDRCPQQVQDLVMYCLNTDPAARPFIADVLARAHAVLAQLEP
ncbi:hypothetical protein N2152v2_006500 [Parachlorella kessleri]